MNGDPVTSITVPRATLTDLHSVKVDMERASQRRITLAEVLAALIETWQNTHQAA